MTSKFLILHKNNVWEFDDATSAVAQGVAAAKAELVDNPGQKAASFTLVERRTDVWVVQMGENQPTALP